MTYVTRFDQLFDRFDSMLNARPTSANSFPFFNLVKNSDTEYTLEVAVAGFSKENVDVEVLGRTLKITGTADADERDYVYKGISTKSFEKTYKLANNVEVAGGELTDGVLHVHLSHTVPDEQKARKIELNGPQLLEG